MALPGGVQITGFLSPTASGDTYATHDALYGRDGLRNVDLLADLDNIPADRRRAGMIVGVGGFSGFASHYTLLPEGTGWTYTFADWGLAFLPASATTALVASAISSDTYITGFTISENTYTLTDNSGNTHTAIWSGNALASCINDFYVSNIHSCSPLYINPNDEGNLYFGSSSGFSLTLTTGGTTNVGINTPSSNYGLHLGAGDMFISDGAFAIGSTAPDPTHLFRVSTDDADGNNMTGARIDMSHQNTTGNFSGLQVRSTSPKYGTSSTLVGVNSNLTGSAISGSHTFVAGRFRAATTSTTGGTATNYALQLEDGTEGTIGHVWTSVAGDGKGHWGAVGPTGISGDTFVSGATFDGVNTIYFHRNDSLSAFTVDLSTLDVNDTFISGMTFNNGTYDLTINRNDGTNFTQSLSILATDMVVTGGTYSISTGVVTFTNNSGGTFNVSGFTSGMTDSYTTTAYTVGNEIRFDNNIQGSNLYNVDLTPILTGYTTGATSPFEYNPTPINGIQPVIGGNVVLSDYSSIGGGKGNTVSSASTHGVIAGGYFNHLEGNAAKSFIGGGVANYILHNSYYSVIAGGGFSTIQSGSSRSFIGGGNNQAIYINSPYSVIGGGKSNKISLGYSTIAGGNANGISSSGTYDTGGFIGGGQYNKILGNSEYGGNVIVGGGSGYYNIGNSISGGSGSVIVGGGVYSPNKIIGASESFIGGGGNNQISGNISFIGAGNGNTISGDAATIVGGNANVAGARWNVIVGGVLNKATLRAGIVVGGKGNLNYSEYTFIGGGQSNQLVVNSDYSSVVGGYENIINTKYSIIGGGSGNTISELGTGATVNTGKFSVIVGGHNNAISGETSSILGGFNNNITHDNAHIIGSNITSFTADTTHVEKLNIGTLNGTTPSSILALDTNGMVVDGSALVSGFTTGATSPYEYNISVPTAIQPVLGNNVVSSSYSNIGGGYNNTILSANTYTNIGGGYNNTIDNDGWSSAIVGGGGNYIKGVGSFIGNGYNNRIIDPSGTGYHVIVGGYNNQTTGGYAFIGSGSYNRGESPRSVIVGGQGNQILGTSVGTHAFIGGGRNNFIGQVGYTKGASYSVIGGGYGNTIDALNKNTQGCIVIGGGKLNNVGIDSSFTTIGGGRDNTANGSDCTIAGGYGNSTTDNNNSIGGGINNSVAGGSSTIGGGDSNIIACNTSTIAGGSFNSISGSSFQSIIGGGQGNTSLNGLASVISGGRNNTISSTGPSSLDHPEFSVIGGGYGNTIISASSLTVIAGGSGNTINTGSAGSTIAGGQGNTVNHSNAHIIGSNITSISADTTHVERLNVGTVDTGSTANELLVREANGMVNTRPLSTFVSSKYAVSFAFTAATTSTITHNLGSTDVIVQVKDASGQLVTPNTVDNYTSNTVDINVSSTETMRVIIIG